MYSLLVLAIRTLSVQVLRKALHQDSMRCQRADPLRLIAMRIVLRIDIAVEFGFWKSCQIHRTIELVRQLECMQA